MSLTKAQRRRARANQAQFAHAIAIGGPRREPNGRLSRRAGEVQMRAEMSEVETKRPMIEARKRQFPMLTEAALDIVDAGKPNVGTVHGLLHLQGTLTLGQFHAADWFIEKRGLWARAIETPGEPDDKIARGSYDPEAHAKFCRDAIELWAKVMQALQAVSTLHRSPIIAALDHVLIRQQNLDHLVGDVRLGLDEIVRVFLK